MFRRKSRLKGMSIHSETRQDPAVAIAGFITFLETGTVPDGLFAPDMFTDLSLPHWRIQTPTAAEIVAVRTEEHHSASEITVERVETTDHGFTIEFTERWDHEGQRWYCREMIRADLRGDTITELAVYCTGDWDEAKQREHAEAVRLIRP
jgi:hypothetical protein